jgi:penicillin-binding protein 1A
MKNGLMITKPGSDYDIYRDGLKNTTIDSRMQLHEAVFAHMANLQEEFFIQAKQ